LKTYSLPGFELNLSTLWEFSKSLQMFDRLPLFEKAHKALTAKFENQTLGFFDWPERMSAQELSTLQEISKDLRARYEGVLVCGIGGSHLGAASVLEALRSEKEESEFPIFWLNNVDRWAIERAKSFVTRRKVATLIISKSGNTTETLSGFFHLSRFLDPKGTVLITDPSSGELRRWVNAHGYLNLPVPPNIGGRFSVLTSVGLLPMALGGIDILALLDGAKQLRQHLAPLNLLDNPAYQYAMASYGWDKKENHSIHYLMPYLSQLKLLTDWFVQLWAESLGKKNAEGGAVGPTFVGALGTRDQHSLLQLFQEGPKNKLIGFIDLKEIPQNLKVGNPPVPSPQFEYLCQHSFEEINSKALQATAKSLNSAGTPTYQIVFEELTCRTLGAFLLFQELACAISGEFYEVNAFNQPGVEEAKRLLRESL
jgi:glucose-6-phosphate isomerase